MGGGGNTEFMKKVKKHKKNKIRWRGDTRFAVPEVWELL